MRFLLFFVISLSLSACGANETVEYRKKPNPDPKPQPEPSAEYKEVAALVQTHCGKCHGPGKAQKAINSAARIKGASGRVANDSMPPGGNLPADVKAKILE